MNRPKETSSAPAGDPTFARGTIEYKRLFGVAYRMLGSIHDTEDALQEGLARWAGLAPEQRSAIREPVAWLTRVISRICLDELGTARARREGYHGIWLPEPLLDATAMPAHGRPLNMDPADAISLDESVSMALLIAMEHLTPPERVSLILHDVFQVSFAEIAVIVGRQPDACRQLASTARRNIRSHRRFEVQGDERNRVVDAFARACLDGDISALAGVLDPNVIARADGGSAITVARRPIMGAPRVAQYLLGVLNRQQQLRHSLEILPTVINGRSGLVIYEGLKTVGIIDLSIYNGHVAEIAIIVNPDKIAQISRH